MSIPTAHNMAHAGQISPTVLMPGDPLRAKFIAENYLDDAELFNDVRNMLGYTGTYKGMPVSVMGHGMGMPSVGIYAHELYNFYDVETIIRVGSAGALDESMQLKDLLAAQAACTNSAYADQYQVAGTLAPIGDFDLLRKAVEIAEAKELPIRVGNVLSSDTFYNDNPNFNDGWKKMGVLAVEMEAAALYLEAMRAGKRALCLLSVSDHIYRDEALSSEERQLGFGSMMEVALEAAYRMYQGDAEEGGCACGGSCGCGGHAEEESACGCGGHDEEESACGCGSHDEKESTCGCGGH